MQVESGLSAQEYVDILNLYGCYNLCSDAGDGEGYAGCFVEEGVLEIPGAGVLVQGRSALARYKRSDISGRGGRYRRHHTTSLHLERIGEDRVRGKCYFHAYNGEPGALPELADAGVYEDTIVRVDGLWRFARRLLNMDAISFKPHQN